MHASKMLGLKGTNRAGLKKVISKSQVLEKEKLSFNKTVKIRGDGKVGSEILGRNG